MKFEAGKSGNPAGRPARKLKIDIVSNSNGKPDLLATAQKIALDALCGKIATAAALDALAIIKATRSI